MHVFDQPGELGIAPSSARQLRLDDRTLSGWRFDSMETLCPGVEKATLSVFCDLRVDDLDSLQLPAVRELCHGKGPKSRQYMFIH